LLGKRFKIKETVLGVGSFGRTYLGRDKKVHHDVAIKIVSYSQTNLSLNIDAEE